VAGNFSNYSKQSLTDLTDIVWRVPLIQADHSEVGRVTISMVWGGCYEDSARPDTALVKVILHMG
jgi:hypothetical protein